MEKKIISAVEISLSRCLLPFRALWAPCPLGIMPLFGTRAVTGLIILSGRMAGLILVTQRMLRCAGSLGGAGRAGKSGSSVKVQVFCVLLPFPMSTCRVGGRCPGSVSQSDRPECVQTWATIRLNCHSDCSLGMISLCKLSECLSRCEVSFQALFLLPSIECERLAS